jgi:hypothetical protein
MTKIFYGLMWMSTLLTVAFGIWSCSKPTTPIPIYSISLQMTNSPCDPVFTLDGGQATTITTSSYMGLLFSNVPKGNHVIGVTAAGYSVSCTENVSFPNYYIDVVTPCTAGTLSCGSIQPE